MIESLKKKYKRVEDFSYNTVYQLIKKFGTLFTPIVIILLLVFFTKLPRDLNIKTQSGIIETNFSLYLSLKHSVLFLRDIISHGIGNLEMVRSAFTKSFVLMVCATLLALVFGVTKGLLDAYANRGKAELRSFFSIVVLSVPDIIWILLSNVLIVLIGKNIEIKALRGFIFPLITLTIMPLFYISRMSYLAFVKEQTQPYVIALKSRGISKMRIFTRHLISPVLEKIFGTLIGLLPVMISNLIVIEYLFDYKGLANYVIMADKSNDEVTLISLIASISVIYFVMTSVFKVLLKLFSVRRKGDQANA